MQEYERAVIFRLGRLITGGEKGPGTVNCIHWLFIYFFHSFLPCDAMLSAVHVYAAPIPSVCPSVCHTPALCQKAERIIEILSLSDGLIIPVFRHQGLLRKSEGFTPNWGAEYNGGSDFDQYVAISLKHCVSKNGPPGSRSHGSVRVVRTTSKVNGKC